MNRLSLIFNFCVIFFYFFFFFKQKTAYEIMPSLVGSEMCIRDSNNTSAKQSRTQASSPYTEKECKGNFGIQDARLLENSNELSTNRIFTQFGTQVNENPGKSKFVYHTTDTKNVVIQQSLPISPAKFINTQFSFEVNQKNFVLSSLKKKKKCQFQNEQNQNNQHYHQNKQSPQFPPPLDQQLMVPNQGIKLPKFSLQDTNNNQLIKLNSDDKDQINNKNNEKIQYEYENEGEDDNENEKGKQSELHSTKILQHHIKVQEITNKIKDIDVLWSKLHNSRMIEQFQKSYKKIKTINKLHKPNMQRRQQFVPRIDDLRPQSYLLGQKKSKNMINQSYDKKQQPISSSIGTNNNPTLTTSKPQQDDLAYLQQKYKERILKYQCLQNTPNINLSPIPLNSKSGNSTPQRYINGKIIIDKAHKQALLSNKKLNQTQDPTLNNSNEVKELSIQQILTKERQRATQQLYENQVRQRKRQSDLTNNNIYYDTKVEELGNIMGNTTSNLQTDRMYTVLSNSNETSEFISQQRQAQ
eukprot:TRINITY_DN443_c0_g1_i7.p1 TRINITY_DN443_c0_g1~~TRINITY_DN443_c0_g1_i7.p1  ORF type:complete len:526 (+),score=104.52 TRINITY_DN443_c0_g1_i7:29-1606(+)